jgi:hypothetical protein
MLRKVWLVAALALVLMPAFAQAQFNQDDWALRLSGSGSSDNDFDSTTVAVAGEIDYFLGDNFSIGLDQGITYADLASGGSDWSAATRVGADFYFDLDRWQPYVGAFIGYLYGDDVDEQFIAGPEVGVAYFVNSTTFIFAEVEYQFLFEDSDDADEAFEDGIWAYALGIGFTW